MKKVFGIIAATLAALSIFVFVGTPAVTAQAAGEYKKAVYEGGVYATNGKQCLSVFFYKSGKNEIVYLNDGTNYAYSEYTLVTSEVPGFGTGTKLTAGEMVLYSFEYDGNEYIMMDDGVLLLAEDITAYEAQQIRDAF
jgi:hypothetical protein